MIFLCFCGAPFWGAPVRPNMLNMPKSASAPQTFPQPANWFIRPPDVCRRLSILLLFFTSAKEVMCPCESLVSHAYAVEDNEICFPRCTIPWNDISSFMTPNFAVPNKGVKQRHYRQWSCDQYSAVSWKKCEIGYKLVLFTNTKSHTGFLLVPKVVTLSDVEQYNGRYSRHFT